MHQAYQPLDKLDLFTRGKSMPSNAIPQSLVQQLNMFSGQTYLMGNEKSEQACAFLGLRCRPETANATTEASRLISYHSSDERAPAQRKFDPVHQSSIHQGSTRLRAYRQNSPWQNAVWNNAHRARFRTPSRQCGVDLDKTW
jgi:hypothetical protein